MSEIIKILKKYGLTGNILSQLMEYHPNYINSVLNEKLPLNICFYKRLTKAISSIEIEFEKKKCEEISLLRKEMGDIRAQLEKKLMA